MILATEPRLFIQNSTGKKILENALTKRPNKVLALQTSLGKTEMRSVVNSKAQDVAHINTLRF